MKKHSQEIAIKVDHLGKTFYPQSSSKTIKEAFVSIGRKFGGHTKPLVSKGEYTALKDINFNIHKGEFFGIVGRNGSGKSTLLKILAGVYTPTKGNVHVNGKLTPFIELGVGFNPELSGRDNVFLNGALLGFTRQEMEEMYESIVEFAELQDFMDTKLKNYSSGMQVRLAFSVAIRAQSDILLIDEVLAVGDAAFQQKCFEYFDRLKQQKKTIVFVSHDMMSVREFCDRAALVYDGRIEDIGSPFDIAAKYEALNYTETTHSDDTHTAPKQAAAPAISVTDASGHRKGKFKYGDDIQITAEWSKELNVGIVGFALYKGSECVFSTNSIGQTVDLSTNKASILFNPRLGSGRYKVLVGLFGKNRRDTISFSSPESEIQVYGKPLAGDHGEEWDGIVYIRNEWR